MVDKYIGQTYGPAGMGMSAYSNIPDPIVSESFTVNELGPSYGPVGMGMSAYMDRPGPMEMAAPPDNIGYDRMGPELVPGVPDRLFRQYSPDSFSPYNKGYPETEREEKLREYMKRGLRARQGIETLEANVDPSDWRVIQQIMGAGGNPDDYIETAGLGSDIYNYLDEFLDFEGMKNQIPYFLDNTIPFYDPPEGYYDEDYEENLEMAEALTPSASFKILQGLADKSPEYFHKTLPMIYGDDLWDQTPMFNYGGDFYGNSELRWG
jgi:hypothetical protein